MVDEFLELWKGTTFGEFIIIMLIAIILMKVVIEKGKNKQ
jgi:hypothetical protein